MIPPKLCFTKSAVNKWAYIPETPPNQPDYPWFLKCTLNLGQEKPMLINSADTSHGSRKIPPGKSPPGKFPPIKLPPENSHPFH